MHVIRHLACLLLSTACVALLLPSKSTAATVRIVEVTASEHQPGHPPEHALDAIRESCWAAKGKSQWLQVRLNQETELTAVRLGFLKGTRRYAFDLEVSTADATWVRVGSFTSAGAGDAVELFRFEKQTAKALRIISQGNRSNTWINLHTLELPAVDLDASILAKGPQEEAPPGMPLKFTKWSGEINIPDPVAISFDNLGRAYVTQTQRRKSQDLDIRAHRDWIQDDLRFQSVADKRAFYHRVLAPRQEGQEQTAPIPDTNGDGSADYRDLTMLSERIHLVTDRDEDGIADQINLFADGFQTEVTGIAAGVLWHNGDVYATIAPDVWRLRDRDGDDKADERSVVATGFGLHIAYGGHDMHGLTVGVDGRLYWSIGDKGISVTTESGRRFHYPNQGGVMRCNPDGSDFEVFAHGLRNVQELAFDQHGNLFGVDNDSDRPGERERFVSIVEGMDAGWRCNYQYRSAEYNPWMNEQLWVPHFAGQPAYIMPPICHSINGPAGFVFNPGTALSPNYRDYFFLTGAPAGEQIAFQVEPVGAGFRMINEHPIGRGIPLVGINFAPDGALYGVDWGGGYPLNEKGAVWKIDNPDDAGSTIRQEVQRRLRNGFVDVQLTTLEELLGHADQRIRLGAQFELVRREALETLTTVAAASGDTVTRLHAVWGLGQLARQGDAGARHVLVTQLAADDAEVRGQAAKACGELAEFDGALLVPLLSDEPRVAFQAAIALGRRPASDALQPIVRMIEASPASDTMMRHAGVMALAGSVATDELLTLQDHRSERLRICAVVALRRQQAAGVEQFLADASPLVVAEAARAIYDDFSIPAAMPALAATLDTAEHRNEAHLRRAIGANFRLGTSQHALRVANYAASEKASQDMRLEALRALAAWRKPSPLDRVTGRYRDMGSANRLDDVSPLQAPLARVLSSGSSKLREASLIAARALQIEISDRVLLAFLKSDADAMLRIETLNSLSAQKSPLLPNAIQHVIAADDVDLRIRGFELLVATQKGASFAPLAAALKHAKSTPARQRYITLLAEIGSDEADRKLLELGSQLPTSLARPETLEILEALGTRAAENPSLSAVAARIEASRSQQAAGNGLAQYLECLDGGDARRGQLIFDTHLQAQCVRCHRVGKTGSTVGPSLADVAIRRDRAYLVRSIVSPSADIDEPYRSRMLILDSGKSVQGLRLREEDDAIILADVQGKEVRVPLDAIEESIEQKVSIMPDMTKTLSKREIRDLVAYLVTLKRKAKSIRTD